MVWGPLAGSQRQGPFRPRALSAWSSTRPLLSCLLRTQCLLVALLGGWHAYPLLVPSALSSSFSLWFSSSSYCFPIGRFPFSSGSREAFLFLLCFFHTTLSLLRPSHSLSSRLLDFLLFLEDTKHTCTSGPLHSPLSPLGVSFLQNPCGSPQCHPLREASLTTPYENTLSTSPIPKPRIPCCPSLLYLHRHRIYLLSYLFASPLEWKHSYYIPLA